MRDVKELSERLVRDVREMGERCEGEPTHPLTPNDAFRRHN